MKTNFSSLFFPLQPFCIDNDTFNKTKKERHLLSDKKTKLRYSKECATTYGVSNWLKQHLPNAQSNMLFMFNFLVTDYR